MGKTYQYPHALYIKTTGEATQDTNTGDWVKAADSWALSSFCRAETNGKANQVSNADGKVLVYTDVIYTPATKLDLSEGREIAVFESEITDTDQLNDPEFIADQRRAGNLKAYGQVFKYDLTRLHGRIWI